MTEDPRSLFILRDRTIALSNLKIGKKKQIKNSQSQYLSSGCIVARIVQLASNVVSEKNNVANRKKSINTLVYELQTWHDSGFASMPQKDRT